MINLREEVERDLGETLEGEWSLPVVLKSPVSGETKTVRGQVLYQTIVPNPETGLESIVDKPNVSVRRSTLMTEFGHIPEAEQPWSITIPETPEEAGNPVTYMMQRPPQGGRSFGWITLYCIEAEQT